jgi:hypothetical protein
LPAQNERRDRSEQGEEEDYEERFAGQASGMEKRVEQ